jgi:hypothetical protein
MNARGPALAGAIALLVGVGLVVREADETRTTASPIGDEVLRVAPPPDMAEAPKAALTNPPPAQSLPARRGETGRFDPTANWPPDDDPPRSGEVTFCGVGRAPAASPTAKALQAQSEARVGDAAARLFSLMAQSAEPQVRAAAQLALDEREALAATARLTSDATVYAMALQACGRGGPAATTPNCAALAPTQLARLDPSNVVPWLHVSTEALQRRDAAGVAEAVFRASMATTSRVREFAFADLALSALPADWPPLDAMHAGTRVLEIHAALTLPSYLAVVQYCARERMHDSNVQQTCDRLARLLMQQGDALIDYGIGRRLGERAGWPADQVALNDARFAAYTQTSVDGDAMAAALAGSRDCRSLRQGVQAAFAHARYGERASAQAEVEAAGLSDATLIERYRQRPRPIDTPASAPR